MAGFFKHHTKACQLAIIGIQVCHHTVGIDKSGASTVPIGQQNVPVAMRPYVMPAIDNSAYDSSIGRIPQEIPCEKERTFDSCRIKDVERISAALEHRICRKHKMYFRTCRIDTYHTAPAVGFDSAIRHTGQRQRDNKHTCCKTAYQQFSHKAMVTPLNIPQRYTFAPLYPKKEPTRKLPRRQIKAVGTIAQGVYITFNHKGLLRLRHRCRRQIPCFLYHNNRGTPNV